MNDTAIPAERQELFDATQVLVARIFRDDPLLPAVQEMLRSGATKDGLREWHLRCIDTAGEAVAFRRKIDSLPNFFVGEKERALADDILDLTKPVLLAVGASMAADPARPEGEKQIIGLVKAMLSE